MAESPSITKMNINHYEAALKLDLDAKRRAAVQRLLTEARAELARTRKAQLAENPS
jgi:hypothetical protein